MAIYMRDRVRVAFKQHFTPPSDFIHDDGYCVATVPYLNTATPENVETLVNTVKSGGLAVVIDKGTAEDKAKRYEDLAQRVNEEEDDDTAYMNLLPHIETRTEFDEYYKRGARLLYTTKRILARPLREEYSDVAFCYFFCVKSNKYLPEIERVSYGGGSLYDGNRVFIKPSGASQAVDKIKLYNTILAPDDSLTKVYNVVKHLTKATGYELSVGNFKRARYVKCSASTPILTFDSTAMSIKTSENAEKRWTPVKDIDINTHFLAKREDFPYKIRSITERPALELTGYDFPNLYHTIIAEDVIMLSGSYGARFRVYDWSKYQKKRLCHHPREKAKRAVLKK